MFATLKRTVLVIIAVMLSLYVLSDLFGVYLPF